MKLRLFPLELCYVKVSMWLPFWYPLSQLVRLTLKSKICFCSLCVWQPYIFAFDFYS